MSEKIRVTFRLRQEVLALVLQHGYATRRTLGEFLSQLILNYHEQHSQLTAAYPSFEEWQQLVDDAEELLHSEAGKEK